ncbi:RNA polymerase II subunit A C-terminal domain phosphatase-like [Physella acuta]|uniref:RNA polymerase II subunit A C-terminal domain phosphatase-like n=1 Tax=Physella acuta TaxID=109671 RepID=UPI0027DE92A7|nr:RNA polymerase II subunit A C-terminal domain phosphatase-like [Physella acuta]
MAATDEEVLSPANIEIVKWKVTKGSMVFKGSVLALYVLVGNENKTQPLKLKTSISGIVAHINIEEGKTANANDVLLTIQLQSENSCTHPTIMKDMCADCGADLRRDNGVAGDRKKSVSASVAMVHSIPELIVSQEQALELGRKDERRLLQQRKLVLLVDLDQTVIHTTNDNIPSNLKDVKHFQLWHGKGYMWYHTRFRPFTLRFLEAVSKMYELHICTFGVRMYAHTIARLLDPEEKYFSHRILSRDECFDALSKTANLKALFPCGDKMVGIIDDREDVWNFAPNLIHVKPYRFFQGTADINAPPGLTKSEHDNEPLAHKIVDHSEEYKKECLAKMDSKKTSEDTKKEEGSGKDDDPVFKEDATPAEAEVVGNVDKTSEDSSGQVEDSCLTNKGDTSEQSVSSDLMEVEGSGDGVVTLDQKPGQGTKCEDNVVGDVGDNNCSNDETDKKESCISIEEKKDSGSDVGSVHVEKTGSENEKDDAGKKEVSKDDEELEWDDEDDYLLHLEEILTRVHKAYYELYEQSQGKGSDELPDLKNIIPYVRKKVLKGANIVFSGMFPLNMPAEQSRAFIVAKALGANVQMDIVPKSSKNGTGEATTHLVAAKAGTGKHKTALKTKGVHVVSGDWLWACNERWEWVEESLYPLVSKDSKTSPSPDPSFLEKKNSRKRKLKGDDEEEEEKVNDADVKGNGDSSSKKCKVSDTESPESTAEVESTGEVESVATTSGDTKDTAFASSFNPLYSFSDEDIEFMDKEVDEIMGEDEDSSDESDEEREVRLREKVLGKSAESDSDSDSLSGDFPRGWKLRRKSFSPEKKEEAEEGEKRTDAEDDDETENELERYQKNMAAFVQPEDSQSDSSRCSDSIGSVDDEIAEAVEKEFLGT